MLGSLRKWSHSSHNIWFLNNKPCPVNYFPVTFCSVLAQARLGQQIVSPKRHDMSHACIFTRLRIAMATIVLIMESQNSKLYIRWSSVFPVDRTLISHWRKALYLAFPSSLDFILCFSSQLVVFSVWTWRGCSQLEDSGTEGDEVTLLSQGQPGTVLVWVFRNGSPTKELLSASL